MAWMDGGMDAGSLAAWVVGAAAAGFAVALAIARRRQLDAQVARLARQVRHLQVVSAQEKRYRPVAADVALDDAYARATHQLSGLGFRSLGDHVEHASDGTAAGGVIRWFVGPADGTVVAWFATFREPATGAVRELTMYMSASADDARHAVTSIGTPPIGLAHPPTLHRERLPLAVGIAEGLSRHRALVTALGPLRRVTGIEEAFDLHRRLLASVRTWRDAQPPEALLEADLEGVLGERHRRLAGRLRDALRALPDRASPAPA